MASVSGRVTLDGEPLASASLQFKPHRVGDAVNVGPTSVGTTDEQGRYRLQTYAGSNGAVVGTHTVSISTYEARLVDPRKSDRVEVISKEVLPSRYRAPSELKFTVPSGGADDANFDLTSG